MKKVLMLSVDVEINGQAHATPLPPQVFFTVIFAFFLICRDLFVAMRQTRK